MYSFAINDLGMSERSPGNRSMPSKYSSVNYPFWARSGFIKKYSQWFTHAILVTSLLPFLYFSYFNAFMLNTLVASAFGGPLLFLILNKWIWIQNVKNLKI